MSRRPPARPPGQGCSPGPSVSPALPSSPGPPPAPPPASPGPDLARPPPLSNAESASSLPRTRPAKDCALGCGPRGRRRRRLLLLLLFSRRASRRDWARGRGTRGRGPGSRGIWAGAGGGAAAGVPGTPCHAPCAANPAPLPRTGRHPRLSRGHLLHAGVDSGPPSTASTSTPPMQCPASPSPALPPRGHVPS